MRKKPSVLIVGSQHGDELLGEQLYDYIRTHSRQISVDYILANPLAHRRGMRYIESDMNRSYVPTRKTYEERQARIVLDYIRQNEYDLVVDAHTTTVDQEPCLIVASIDTVNKRYLRASHIQNIVVMRHDFVSQSLIGHASNAVSLEISTHRIDPTVLHALSADIEAYVSGSGVARTKDIFTVTDLLYKTDAERYPLNGLRNFERMKDGRYPVLMGEDAYRKHTDYLGFVAQTKEIIKV